MSQTPHNTPADVESIRKIIQTYLDDIKHQTLTVHGKYDIITQIINTHTTQINKNIEYLLNIFPNAISIIIQATKHHQEQQQIINENKRCVEEANLHYNTYTFNFDSPKRFKINNDIYKTTPQGNYHVFTCNKNSSFVRLDVGVTANMTRQEAATAIMNYLHKHQTPHPSSTTTIVVVTPCVGR